MNISVRKCQNNKGEYFTIVNNNNGFHCHTMSEYDTREVLRIAECIEKGLPVKCRHYIRNKALKLFICGKKL